MRRRTSTTIISTTSTTSIFTERARGLRRGASVAALHGVRFHSRSRFLSFVREFPGLASCTYTRLYVGICTESNVNALVTCTRRFIFRTTRGSRVSRQRDHRARAQKPKSSSCPATRPGPTDPRAFTRPSCPQCSSGHSHTASLPLPPGPVNVSSQRGHRKPPAIFICAHP